MAWSYDEEMQRRKAEAEAQEAAELEKNVQPEESGGVMSWVQRLPKNIAKGTYLAALNTIDAAEEYGGAALGTGNPNNPFSPANISRLSGIAKGESSEGEADKEQAPEETPATPLSAAFPEVYQALHNYADEIREDATLGDGLVQGATQFALPFAGWLKMLGGTTKGQKLASAFGAEAITAATAFEPDEGRLAELVEFGRQMDNRYGEFLNKLVPDGSLLNRYIDLMTADRENESRSLARFKNAVDSVVFTAGAAAFIKVAGQTLRAGRTILAEGGAAAGTPARQRGMVTFHTTPFRRRESEFIDDVFSMERVGSGEGADAFGHGLYFAENPSVAGNYKYTTGMASVRRHFRQALSDDADFEDVMAEVGTGTFTPEQDAVIKALAKDDWLGFDYPSQAINAAFSRNMERLFDPSPALKKAVKNATVTLDVDIPDGTINRMLRQDVDLVNQPDNVKQALLKAQDEFGHQSVPTEAWMRGDIMPRADGQTGFFEVVNNGNGREVYTALTEILGSKKKASEWLKENGVPGMQFLDAESRTFTGSGGFIKPLVEAAKGKKPTRNFILFGNENIDRVSQEGQTVFERAKQ
jgi:hypothetical protein